MDKLPFGPLTFHIGNVWVSGMDENYVIDAGNVEVAWLIDGDLAQQKAYAELFAAAPDTLRQRDGLLEALRDAKIGIEEFPDIGTAYEKLEYKDKLVVSIEAAIADATE